MIKRKIESRPEVVKSRRKRRASSLTIEHVVARRAVDQMLSMALVDSVCSRGVGGRASGRFVRYKRHDDALQTMKFSPSEAAGVMHKTFTRVNGTVATRLLLERHVDDEGQVWYVLARNTRG